MEADRTYQLKARWIVPVHAEPCCDAVLVVRDGIVQAIEQPAQAGLDCVDLGNAAILPAFYNAHTHLEFAACRQPLASDCGLFSAWLRNVIELRIGRDADPAAKTNALLAGMRECLNQAVIGVGEISTAGVKVDDLPPSPLRGVSFVEWIGLGAERVKQLISDFDQAWETRTGQESWQVGISPHAPYTASWELVRASVARSERWRIPLTMHLGETIEEVELLASHSGPLWELLQERGVWNPAAVPRGIELRDYVRLLSKAHRVLIAHGNLLGPEEWQVLAENTDRMALVHCPRTHRHFGRPAFPLADLLDAHVPVVLGTDSRASNPDLAIWREAQLARRLHPTISDHRLLEMITRDAARSLGFPPQSGTLAPGQLANLAILRLPDEDAESPYPLLWQDATQVVAAYYEKVADRSAI